MTFSVEHASRLPENLSGIITNPNHLLNSVSPTALIRADGWQIGALQIDTTCKACEVILDPRTRSVSAGTTVATNDNKAPIALAA